MLLGLSSSLRHEDAKDWAKKMKDLGCGCVNFPINCDAPDHVIADYADAARDEGLVIAEVGIWRNVFAIDPEEREEARRFALGQLRLADEIGARCCVNVMGTYGGPVWDGGYRENFTKECWDLSVAYTQSLIDEVKPKRTHYTVEPMPWMIPTGPDECLRLRDAVDREAFAIHLDVVNMINCPERYFFADEFLDECFDKLGPIIESCHLKDIRLSTELTFMLIETYCGDGVLNIEKYISLINQYDPDMPVIIEHLNTDEEYLASLQYVKTRLARAGL